MSDMEYWSGRVSFYKPELDTHDAIMAFLDEIGKSELKQAAITAYDADDFFEFLYDNFEYKEEPFRIIHHDGYDKVLDTRKLKKMNDYSESNSFAKIGTLEFEVAVDFYNGGACIGEMLEEGLKDADLSELKSDIDIDSLSVDEVNDLLSKICSKYSDKVCACWYDEHGGPQSIQNGIRFCIKENKSQKENS